MQRRHRFPTPVAVAAFAAIFSCAAEPDPGPIEPHGSSEAPPVEADPHPWADALASVRGRITDAQGRPLPSLAVEVLEWDLDTNLPPDLSPMRRPGPVAGRTRTASDGSFRVGGLSGTGVHAVVVDPGGGRASVHVVRDSLVHGTERDLGDLALAPSRPVVGRVVDAAGRPVPGARVRIAAIDDGLLDSDWLTSRAPTPFVAGHASGDLSVEPDRLRVVELFAAAHDFAQRLPIPTAEADANGAFRVESVPFGDVRGAVDGPGFAPTRIESFELAASESSDPHDVGALVLTYGRSVRGRVVDHRGRALANVDVAVGAMRGAGVPASLRSAGRTDARGRFELKVAPLDGRPVAVARPNGAATFWSAAERDGADSITIAPPPSRDLEIRLRSANGEPVDGATFWLTSASESTEPLGRGLLWALMRVDRKPTPSEAVAPGASLVRALPHGRWTLRVQADGHAVAVARFEHTADSGALELELDEGRTVEVVVVEEESGDRLRDVWVAAMFAGDPERRVLDAGFTGTAGSVRLGPLPTDAVITRPRVGLAWATRTLLVLEHPNFGRQVVPWRDPSSDTVFATLRKPASIEGRIELVGEASVDELFVTLREPLGTPGSLAPRYATVRPDGSFRFAQLPPSRYDLSVGRTELRAPTLDGLRSMVVPSVLAYAVELSLYPGERRTVDVPVDPSGAATAGRLEGRVLFEGEPVEDAVVQLREFNSSWAAEQKIPVKRLGEPDATARTDANGEFRVDGFERPARYRVTIRKDRTVYFDGPESVTTNAVSRVDADVRSCATEFTIVDAASGAPIAGATVAIRNSIEAFRANETTDDGGVASAEVLFDLRSLGPIQGPVLDVAAPGYMPARLEYDGRDARRSIALTRTVSCTGTVSLPRSERPANLARITAFHDGGGARAVISLEERDGRLEFSTDRLGAGLWFVREWVSGQTLYGEFVVPDGGSGELEVVLRPLE